jgi:hypothetical protein
MRASFGARIIVHATGIAMMLLSIPCVLIGALVVGAYTCGDTVGPRVGLALVTLAWIAVPAAVALMARRVGTAWRPWPCVAWLVAVVGLVEVALVEPYTLCIRGITAE